MRSYRQGIETVCELRDTCSSDLFIFSASLVNKYERIASLAYEIAMIAGRRRFIVGARTRLSYGVIDNVLTASRIIVMIDASNERPPVVTNRITLNGNLMN